MEVLFGFFGVLCASILILTAVIVSRDYSMLEDTVSALGGREGKTLFSIGFVVAGSLLIPFYIYLERELINIKEGIRRLATGVSIFFCVCIALVGIIPDETYWDFFVIFHGIVASFAFVGSSIYIVLYSILMYHSPKSKLYKGPAFKKYLAYFGFGIGAIFVILMIFFIPIIEWILTILIFAWILLTAMTLISYKFFNIPGVYYKRAQYPEALKLFEDAIQILNKLKLSDEPITETLKENIEFIKKELDSNLNQVNNE